MGDVDRGLALTRLRSRSPEPPSTSRCSIGPLPRWIWTVSMSARQLLVDAAVSKPEAIAGDVATLETIWARSRHTVDASGAAGIDARLGALRAAAERDDASAAARAVPAFMEALAHVQPA